jgi:hypothetical protein
MVLLRPSDGFVIRTEVCEPLVSFESPVSSISIANLLSRLALESFVTAAYLCPPSLNLFLKHSSFQPSKMQLPIEIALVVSASYIVYLFLSDFLVSRRNAANARKLGCKEPPVQRNRYPLGIDNLLRAINADKAKQFPVDAIKRTVDNGSITYKYSLLGSTNYFTADEKNIQTILATNFSDWDVSTLVGGSLLSFYRKS